MGPMGRSHEDRWRDALFSTGRLRHGAPAAQPSDRPLLLQHSLTPSVGTAPPVPTGKKMAENGAFSKAKSAIFRSLEPRPLNTSH